MKAVFALGFILIAGFLIYEVVSGQAVQIIQNFRGSGSNNSSSPTINNGPQNANSHTPQIIPTPNQGVA
jgi:hypothetical protein